MDFKKIVIFLVTSIMFVTGLIVHDARDRIFRPSPKILYYAPLDNMPVLEGPRGSSGAPQEDRGIEYRRFLASSLKIRVSSSSGSGTIVYYDHAKNEAWVVSCGHLWSGTMSAEEGRSKRLTAKVITWYHNEQKLSEPRTYPAEVLFYRNKNGYDMSLLKFTPDWMPDYFPIAQANYSIQVGDLHHATGCDGGREVARYEVQIIEVGNQPGQDTRSTRNSARPGRSGGGLLTDDGFFIGITWGTTDTRTGNGNSIHTSLASIRSYFANQGYNWLLDVPPPFAARHIPIQDRANPTRIFPKDYIPMPRWLRILI